MRDKTRATGWRLQWSRAECFAVSSGTRGAISRATVPRPAPNVDQPMNQRTIRKRAGRLLEIGFRLVEIEAMFQEGAMSSRLRALVERSGGSRSFR